METNTPASARMMMDRPPVAPPMHGAGRSLAYEGQSVESIASGAMAARDRSRQADGGPLGAVDQRGDRRRRRDGGELVSHWGLAERRDEVGEPLLHRVRLELGHHCAPA